jgi:Xaa-Pro dipeptidase
MLANVGARGARLGIETNAYGLTHFNGRRVDAALGGLCTLVEASSLIDEVRAVKSQAELACAKRAAVLADAALKVGLEQSRPGADEAWILAAMQAAILAGGGDYPGNEFIIGSGEMRCCVDTSRIGACCRTTISLRWNSPAPGGTTMPR